MLYYWVELNIVSHLFELLVRFSEGIIMNNAHLIHVYVILFFEVSLVEHITTL
jgi:hypothetical protein